MNIFECKWKDWKYLTDWEVISKWYQKYIIFDMVTFCYHSFLMILIIYSFLSFNMSVLCYYLTFWEIARLPKSKLYGVILHHSSMIERMFDAYVFSSNHHSLTTPIYHISHHYFSIGVSLIHLTFYRSESVHSIWSVYTHCVSFFLYRLKWIYFLYISI